MQEAGLIPVTFRRRSADFSNTRVFGLAERVLKKVRSGDIIALHDTYPGSDQGLKLWLQEVESLIVGLQEKGLRIVSLDHLVDDMSLPKGAY